MIKFKGISFIALASLAVCTPSLASAKNEAESRAALDDWFKHARSDVPEPIRVCLKVARTPGELNWSTIVPSDLTDPDGPGRAEEKMKELLEKAGHTLTYAIHAGRYLLYPRGYSKTGTVYQIDGAPVCHGFVDRFNPNPYLSDFHLEYFGDESHLFQDIEILGLHFEKAGHDRIGGKQYFIYRDARTGARIYVYATDRSWDIWEANPTVPAPLEFFVINPKSPDN